VTTQRTPLLPCVEVEPRLPARRAVVWLHGLGADGHDFEPIVPELGLDPELAVRFVFPHAPAIPVSINGGFVMPAWYDIRDLDLALRHDAEGVRASAARVADLIRRENERGIPCSRIVLAGFSQGGAIALYLGLRLPERLAGLVGLSTYLVGESSLEREASPANRSVPIFQAHGSFDPMVTCDRGRAAHARLAALGYRVTFQAYPMQHQVCLEEIRDLGAFLTRCFAAEPRS
jgi:phospholipase/carboxylesterase